MAVKLDLTKERAAKIEQISHPILSSIGIDLHVLRDDLLHPAVSGNKWRKLKYNLLEAKSRGVKTIVTFGGAFSNHIYATAMACKLLGLESLGIIRGEYDPRNPTLRHAHACKMQLYFLDRETYRLKEESQEAMAIMSSLSNYMLIPEGGTNDNAMMGLGELADEINKTDADTVLVSAGTGGTATGILKGLHEHKRLWVFSSLKDPYIEDVIRDQVTDQKSSQMRFVSEYHFGGYGKTKPTLITKINEFKQETGLAVDPIYNGKLVVGFLDMVATGQVIPRKKYLWINTGGLQGVAAYNYLASKKGKRLLDR